MTKTISIYIFLEDEPSVECITAGNSAEHNATTLKFILESTFTDEFKYYLDFVLPNGKILRTDYLPLDKNDENSVSFDVPASVTKYGTAECCLNAVKIDENGITTEVMKPKNVILYFNTLADADGALLSDYDFSVNTMLENIKNGVFKGEKGETGGGPWPWTHPSFRGFVPESRMGGRQMKKFDLSPHRQSSTPSSPHWKKASTVWRT